MANNSVSLGNLRKHLTEEEKAARAEAEGGLSRVYIRLVKPKYITQNKLASSYWNLTRKRMEGIEMFDNVDTDVFASYCMICARLEKIRSKYDSISEKIEEAESVKEQASLQKIADSLVKRIESTEKNQLAYAEKLGLTPQARTRLAKRKADESQHISDTEINFFGD